MCKTISGPWESRRETGAALWLKRYQSSMPRAMFRISPFPPMFHKPFSKRSYGLKSDVILSIIVVMKWVLIYMPGPHRNTIRAVWIQSVQALNEKLKAGDPSHQKKEGLPAWKPLLSPHPEDDMLILLGQVLTGHQHFPSTWEQGRH